MNLGKYKSSINMSREQNINTTLKQFFKSQYAYLYDNLEREEERKEFIRNILALGSQSRNNNNEEIMSNINTLTSDELSNDTNFRFWRYSNFFSR